jgi:hypothetical protein
MKWRLQTNPDEFNDELFLWNGQLTSLAHSTEAYLPHEDSINNKTPDYNRLENHRV